MPDWDTPNCTSQPAVPSCTESLQTSASVEHAATGAQLVPSFSRALELHSARRARSECLHPASTTLTVASTVTVCPFTDGFADVAIPVMVEAALDRLSDRRRGRPRETSVAGVDALELYTRGGRSK